MSSSIKFYNPIEVNKVEDDTTTSETAIIKIDNSRINLEGFSDDYGYLKFGLTNERLTTIRFTSKINLSGIDWKSQLPAGVDLDDNPTLKVTFSINNSNNLKLNIENFNPDNLPTTPDIIPETISSEKDFKFEIVPLETERTFTIYTSVDESKEDIITTPHELSCQLNIYPINQEETMIQFSRINGPWVYFNEDPDDPVLKYYPYPLVKANRNNADSSWTYEYYRYNSEGVEIPVPDNPDPNNNDNYDPDKLWGGYIDANEGLIKDLTVEISYRTGPKIEILRSNRETSHNGTIIETQNGIAYFKGEADSATQAKTAGECTGNAATATTAKDYAEGGKIAEKFTNIESKLIEMGFKSGDIYFAGVKYASQDDTNIDTTQNGIYKLGKVVFCNIKYKGSITINQLTDYLSYGRSPFIIPEGFWPQKQVTILTCIYLSPGPNVSQTSGRIMEITIDTNGTNTITHYESFGVDTNQMSNPERTVNINFSYESS